MELCPLMRTFLAILVIVSSVVLTDTRRCGKSDRGAGKAKCKLSRDINSRSRKSTSSDKSGKPVWRSGVPKLDNVIAREGGRIVLNCAVKGTPTPKISWLVDGRKLRSVRRRPRKYRQRRTKLTIKSLEVKDSARYTCNATNRKGSFQHAFIIRVLENMPLKEIEVIAGPENQTAHPGDTVIFKCRSEDWPRPNIYWTRKTDSQNVMEVVEHLTNDTDVLLVVHNVSKADSGVYTCFIGNELVNRELSARLRVIDQGERLPFEPQCSLHIRREHVIDHSSGCRTGEPVEIYYCMGSCGRSYYVPQMIITDPPDKVTGQGAHLKQTCQCCVGTVGGLRIVELDCPLGIKKRAFYTVISECQCQTCNIGGNIQTEFDQTLRPKEFP